ncbi:hypothetical protein BR93DRAFT_254601 [Coniochaeta sp. PMI_546]|nr:hypothetical protein BR93DRAFT_254601 [Coniochaeta sp. PMI_546]
MGPLARPHSACLSACLSPTMLPAFTGLAMLSSGKGAPPHGTTARTDAATSEHHQCVRMGLQMPDLSVQCIIPPASIPACGKRHKRVQDTKENMHEGTCVERAAASSLPLSPLDSCRSPPASASSPIARYRGDRSYIMLVYARTTDTSSGST